MNFSHAFKERRKYTRYHSDVKLVDEVFTFFKQHEPWTYELKTLSETVNIPEPVLCRWRKSFERDPSYRPGGKYGKHRRSFTDEQEAAVKDFLITQYIVPGRIVRRKHLRGILFDLWKSFDLASRGNIQKNFFSNHFILLFCKRNGLSLRQMRKKKRSLLNHEETAAFERELDEIFRIYPRRCILNMDESAWNFVYTCGQVLAITGKEEVDARLPDDYRKSFTVIATISASGDRYPPLFLAQGTTNACHKQFEGMLSEDEDYLLHHSKGGNTNDDVMVFYLHKIRELVGEPCALILDQYAAHVSETTKRTAEECNIRLVYIPVSGTDVYQPLDLRVFGALKSTACSMIYDRIFETDGGLTKPQAADLFVKIWKKMSISVIKSAWQLIKNDEEESDDDDSDAYLLTKGDMNFSLRDSTESESESDSESDSESE